MPTAVTIPKLGDEINISEDGITYNEVVNFENIMVGKHDMKFVSQPHRSMKPLKRLATR